MAVPSTQADVLAQSTAVAQAVAKSQGGTFTQGVGYKPNTTPNTIFDASVMSNAKPFVMPESQLSTAPAATSAFITSSVLAPYQAQRQNDINAMEKTADTGRNAIQKIYDSLAGKGAAADKLNKELGVDTKLKAVDEVTNQLEAEQHALQRSIEQIQANPEGKLASGIQNEIARVTRESVAKQADLAIIQSAATRNYSTAAAIAQKKLDNMFEPMVQQLDALKFFYSENRQDLTKKQDQQYQELIQANQNDYQQKYDAAKLAQSTKLQLLQTAAGQGAPASVLQGIQTAATAEEAVAAAGKYGTDQLDRQLKLAQIGSANRANRDSGAAKVFTPTQINDALYRAGVSRADFDRMSFDEQNFFVNGDAALKSNKTYIDEQLAAGTSAAQLEGELAAHQDLPPAVKDNLTKYLFSVAPK